MANFRKIDEQWGWVVRWLGPLFVSALLGAMVLWLKAEFVTRDEGKEMLNALQPLPAKIDQLQKDIEPLKLLPLRVQTLEEKSQVQSLTNVRREGQVDELKDLMSKLAVQQERALTKLEDISRRTERTENKVDDLSTGRGK